MKNTVFVFIIRDITHTPNINLRNNQKNKKYYNDKLKPNKIHIHIQHKLLVFRRIFKTIFFCLLLFLCLKNKTINCAENSIELSMKRPKYVKSNLNWPISDKAKNKYAANCCCMRCCNILFTLLLIRNGLFLTFDN